MVEVEGIGLLIEVYWQASILTNYSVSCPTACCLDTSLIISCNNFIRGILNLLSYDVHVALYSIAV